MGGFRLRIALPLLRLVLFGLLPGLPSAALAQAQSEPQYQIAIIIDDIGYSAARGQRAILLPGALTFAIIPFTPHADSLTQLAQQQGREVMLHMPMEGSLGNRLDKGGINRQHSRHEVKQRVRAAFQSLPAVTGFNNHMGSRLTTDPIALNWVMQSAPERTRFFIDSMTNADSVAANIASHYGIPTLRRDVFLDPLQSPKVIAVQYQRLLTVARSKGYAIAIGHPYPATLELLEQQLPLLAQHDIELVPVSSLVNKHYPRLAHTFWDSEALLRHLAKLPIPKIKRNIKPSIYSHLIY